MLQKLKKFFSVPVRLSILNGLLLLIIICGNFYWQSFCIPTAWATALLIVCFGNTVVFPLIPKDHLLEPLSSFICGISFCLYIYCILFLEQMNIYGLFFILAGIGAIVFIPHFLAFQLFWLHVKRPVSNIAKKYFTYGIAFSFLLITITGFAYYDALEEIKRFKKEDYKSLERNFFTEKILGMHFIYHTRFCEYDGWRPPKHEPLLIIGMWLNGRKDPLPIRLEKRIALYKRFFSQNKIKFDCSCAYQYRHSYHNDEIWKQFDYTWD